MKYLFGLLFLLLFAACDAKITHNTAVDTIVDEPKETINYHFTFKGDKLLDFNTSGNREMSTNVFTYIDATHVDLKETIVDRDSNKSETLIRHFLYDDTGRLLSVTSPERFGPKRIVTTNYSYNEKGFISRKSSQYHDGDIRYETDDQGRIIKEVYQDHSGFNLFIYEEGGLKALNFYDDRNKFFGSLIFKKPISQKTLMLLE